MSLSRCWLRKGLLRASRIKAEQLIINSVVFKVIATKDGYCSLLRYMPNEKTRQ